MMGIKQVLAIFNKSTSIVPLVIYRIVFGILMCFSQIRFLWKGWVEDCYISPKMHFTYQYFDWIKPADATTMYIIVVASAVFAFFISIGLLYRVSAILFFLSFTYLELIEKSWYLNHYYFASLVAFLLIWIPAHRNYSVDALLQKKIRLSRVPSWTIDILKIQIAVVYIFGGIAKLKSDWLLDGQPLKIWLKARTDIPVLGPLFSYDTTAYFFSWSGMLYDLSIPFLLWNKQSRPWAYVLVVVFHVLTYILFNIGMFPWLMIAGSLIFITNSEWKTISKKIGVPLKKWETTTKGYVTHKMAIPLLLFFITFQFLFPLRHYILTDNVLWTENGLRFAWHVMIMEKNGFTEFTIIDKDTNKKFTVYPSDHLTSIQEKQMSFQPDMIWQFAQYLKEEYHKKEYNNISIFVTSKVSLNGRPSRLFIDPKINLLGLKSMDDMYGYVIK